MNNDFNISTSLICCDLSNVSADTDIIVENEGFNWLHADFMDGHFVPRYGISPELIQSLRRRYGNKVFIDSHLMVEDPYYYAKDIAPYSDWFFFHYEAVTDPLRTLQMLKKEYKNLKIGLVFNIFSFINAGENFADFVNTAYINNLIDGIMFMGISPGVLGTNSYPDIVNKKIRSIRNYTGNNIKIFIDGGVNYNTVEVFKLGSANVCVSGSSMIFKKADKELSRSELIKYNIEKIKETIW